MTEPFTSPDTARHQSNLLHASLSQFNGRRLEPATPVSGDFRREFESNQRLTLLEDKFLEQERAHVAAQAAASPSGSAQFMAWFESLEESGPGQHDPLFNWLAERATAQDMAWFVMQECAGEAGFDDLVSLTQLRFPSRPKLEMARNYWDEMGRGCAEKMHGPMLDQLVVELESHRVSRPVVWEARALSNVQIGLAANRRYAYHSVGSLGAVELTAPGRCALVTRGLERLGMSKAAVRYYRLHATVDILHSRTWNREIIRPLVESDPSTARWIAEGALMRLSAGKRCFDRYRQELGVAVGWVPAV